MMTAKQYDRMYHAYDKFCRWHEEKRRQDPDQFKMNVSPWTVSYQCGTAWISFNDFKDATKVIDRLRKAERC